MNRIHLVFITMLLASGTLYTACKKEEKTTTTNNTTPTTTDSLSIHKKIYGATDVYIDGDYVVIKVNCLPDHKTPYYQGTQWATEKYEAYNGTNPMFHQNPNKISQQNLTFRIPRNPKESSAHSATPMGPIGVSLNGIPLFNQYAAGGSPLTGEINSFDQHAGHPQQQGQYHYHIEPTYLTGSKGKDALIGFLLDGFPVYGPTENGKTVSNSDLDAYHGHTTATADYPNGIYHYHFTADAPYLNGDGFFGTAGTVSN
jgi:hypothetical protein